MEFSGYMHIHSLV